MPYLAPPPFQPKRAPPSRAAGDAEAPAQPGRPGAHALGVGGGAADAGVRGQGGGAQEGAGEGRGGAPLLRDGAAGPGAADGGARVREAHRGHAAEPGDGQRKNPGARVSQTHRDTEGGAES